MTLHHTRGPRSYWVVCIHGGTYFGRVGLVERNAFDNATHYTQKVQVQFGNSGPFAHFRQQFLLRVVPLMHQVEENTGQTYLHCNPDEE